MKKNASLKIKALLLLSIGPLFMLVMLVLFWEPARRLGDSLESVKTFHENFVIVTDVEEERRAATDAVLNSVLTGDAQKDEYNEHSANFERAWAMFVREVVVEEIDIQALRNTIDRQKQRELLVLSRVEAGDVEEARALITNEYFQQNDVFMERIHSRALQESGVVFQLNNQAQWTIRMLLNVFIGGFLVSVIFGGALVLFFLNRFKLRIDSLIATSKAVAAGDFSRRVDVETRDELGEFAESFNRMAQRLEATNSSLNREVSMRTQALEESVRKLKDEEGTLESTENALLNILEDLKEDENELRANQEQYRKLIESMPIGLAVNKDEEVVFVNSTAMDILGASSESEIIGKNFWGFIADESKEEIAKFSQRFDEEQGKIDLGEQVLRRLDGEDIHVDAKVVAITFKGEPAGMTVFADISKRKQAEENLQKINQLKSRFITALTHVTRTPLNAIRWNIELLLSGDMGQLREDQKILLRNALQSESQILRLLRHMNIVLDIERDALRLDFQLVSLAGLVSSVAGEDSKYFELADIDLHVDFPNGKDQTVSVDVELMRVALGVLFNNALKYSSQGDTVRVSLKKKDGKLRFEISDEGIGIPESEQTFIFDRFYRASNASTKHPDGSGIGLYIAKHVIEAHDGEIGFESKEGERTTFWFTLPIKKN